ncbi:MAG: tRNA uridine-5-carboxymethylaminomethyl(34) synthesis enzyme MnmG [Muribaculaceae bacterium]|nr:tRNA uridine-5-carboxymethylaminomethyl(34) synthesis enzyme MnmG [Muribaculaceae bacterium]
MKFEFDVIVIGAGHAGCEAAVAAARLGASTLLITKDLNRVAQMSCNPAVGGIAKGQIVREIDALGGMMGIVADTTAIQFRMLNRSKGPAVWSPRVQSDRSKYIDKWRQILDDTPGLYLFQDTVERLIINPSKPKSAPSSPSDQSSHSGQSALSAMSDQSIQIDQSDRAGRFVAGVVTHLGFEFKAPQVILTAGTFLNGLMHFGSTKVEGGRIAEDSSKGLTEQLIDLGFRADRMKTGTPARIDGRTIDFSLAQRQEGDSLPYEKFSFLPEVKRALNPRPCWIVHTNPEAHAVMTARLAESPLYNGDIQSIGPRYCPSIETKLVTFADKESHQLFLEPEGETTQEYYINGFSSSMPWDVQVEALSKIPALKDVQFYRPGYAIEYDFFDPTQLTHDLQTKLVAGLFFAGQVNGTTGYEEAAAQGLVAGINAARRAKALPPVTLGRDQAYIGVLIDDLVTKGVDEPYRMFTSRAEYRILLRQDDADLRLTPIGFDIGLADERRYELMKSKYDARDSLIKWVESYTVKMTPQFNLFLETKGTAPLSASTRLVELLRRPQLNFRILEQEVPALRERLAEVEEGRRDEIIQSAEILIKYEGYIRRERELADKQTRFEHVHIPDGFDFMAVNALSIEARQKLNAIRPATLGQAGRIPGVSPADINVLQLLIGR